MVKQVIVVRKDLKMRKGKIAAQSAHASMKVILDMMVNSSGRAIVNGVIENCKTKTLHMPLGSSIEEWINGKFTKICVSVDSESELDHLYEMAKEHGVPCAMIIDEGLTEFNGVKTKTCIAVGPAKSDEVDHITGGLSLL
jgi:PTH2 family peptidyl-tRNA hydrolase